MNLFDLFEKLINEHASAAALRDHLAFIREKFSVLTSEYEVLERENAELKEQNRILQKDNADLKAKITEAQKPHFSQVKLTRS